MRISKSIQSCIVLAFIAMFVFVTVMASPVYAETALPEGSVQDETVLSDPAEPAEQAEQTEAEDAIQMEKSASANPEEADATVMTEEPAQAEPAEPKTAVRAKVAAQDEGTDSNLVQAPLDFVNGTPGASGDGWTWDKESKTLTLNGLVMNLKEYGEPYEAAINLPGDSVIVVQSDSGMDIDKSHVAIYSAGDLTIQGNATLKIYAETAADGIQAKGNINIGKGKNPKKGLQIIVQSMGFGIYAGGAISVNGSNLSLDIADPNGTYKGTNKGTMIADGTGIDSDAYSIDIQDSNLSCMNQATGSYGILARNGSVRIKNSDYGQTVDKSASKDISGIIAGSGNVNIISSDIEADIWTYLDQSANMQLLSANNLTISDSLVKGRGDGKGLNAQGNVGIDSSSDIDITAVDNALYSDADVSIADSNIRLISTGAYKNAMNTTGAVTIDDSEVYLSGKGERSAGLYTTSMVRINGDSYVDTDGALTAIQMIAVSETAPITLGTGLGVREGGELQHISSDNKWTYFYSEKTQAESLEDASKHVVIAKKGRLIFLEQPEDITVDYPNSASFEVRVSRDDKVASYQWYVKDFVGQAFKLKGQSATTPELIIPSTDQRDNRLSYYCVVTDTAGNELVSKEAYLNIKNKDINYTVLYVGNYAINPGESLNLGKATNPNIGTGTISLGDDGTTILMDNVRLNNNNSMYDVLLSPSHGIRLVRNQATDTSTDVEYKVILKGSNEIINSLKDDGGNGITMDFMLYGGEKGKSPTVILDGESQRGNLRVKGGTVAIRAIANLEINADIVIEPLKAGDTSYLDGIIADGTDGIHDIAIGANHKLDLTTYGSGINASGALSVGENTEINVDMTMPLLIGGQDAGAQDVERGAVRVGSDKLELKPGTKLDISCITDPDIITNVAACYGLWLHGAGLLADSSTISINMSAKPYEDPEYGKGLYGIAAKSYVNMKNSSLDVSLDGDTWYQTAYGVLAQSNVTMDNCKANIAVSGSREAFGLAANMDQTLTGSQIDVTTKYTTDADSNCSYGILGSKTNLDVSKQGSYIKADATNADGIAFIATTGATGNTPKSYDPSYKAKMIKGSYDVVQPQNAAISIASIPGGQHQYVDLETFYDTKDTSKPANCVELAVVQPSPVDPTPVGSKHNVAGSTYVVKSADAVSLVKAKSKKSFTLPATVKISGKTFKVTGIQKNAFKGKKVRTLIVKTKKLTKKSVKGSLKGSKVSKVRVKVGNKKTNKKYVKKYKKIFTKKNAGRKVKVTL